MPKKTPGRPPKKAAKPRRPRAPSRKTLMAADRYIGDQLKAVYDAVAAEPIPDRLVELLNRLDTDLDK